MPDLKKEKKKKKIYNFPGRLLAIVILLSTEFIKL
jgi:hypothetical protein